MVEVSGANNIGLAGGQCRIILVNGLGKIGIVYRNGLTSLDRDLSQSELIRQTVEPCARFALYTRAHLERLRGRLIA